MAQARRQTPSWRRRRAKNKGGAVGTEAVANANVEKNSRNFGYPAEGFVTHIEHSLLYNMISEPKVYPEAVVIDHIDQEDFTSYIVVSPVGQASLSNNGEEERISYAQLSAILALSAEKFPPQKEDSTQQPSIPQKLCKTVLQCVVRYAEEHDLDRQAEIRELMQPVERRAMERNNKAALTQILPFYVGYAASLVTANPVPMLVGATVMSAMGDGMQEEKENVQSFASETNRTADVEKTSLLDEADDL